MPETLPTPLSPPSRSLNGKDHHHKDVIRSALSIAKSSISTPRRSLVLKFLIIAVCVILVHGFVQSIRGNIHTNLSTSDDHFKFTTTGSRADWKGETPEFCKRFIANPKPFVLGCKRDPKTLNCVNTGELIMFSQFGQDYYLFTKHFAKLKRPGIYLDVAANNPLEFSNTYFMDRCLGWKGICVEGNPRYYESLYRERSCHLVPTCVGSRDGETVTFILEGYVGGVLGDTFKHTEAFAKQNKTLTTSSAKCTTMALVLKRNKVLTVDFLSLDVEGHELEVLKGFDWDNVKINVISVETSPKTLEPIEKLLTENGYKRHIPQLDEKTIQSGLLGFDAVFLLKDVVFGSPV